MANIILDNAKGRKNGGGYNTIIDELFKQIKSEKIDIGEDMIKKYLSTPGTDKHVFIDNSLSNEMKNFIADNIPELMGSIKTPTPHMVSKLFDDYGTVNKSGNVNRNFTEITKHWLGYTEYFIENHVTLNPRTVKLLKAEAMRRKGAAPAILIAVLRRADSIAKQLEKKKNGGGGSYISFEPPKVRVMNSDWVSGPKKEKSAVSVQPDADADDDELEAD